MMLALSFLGEIAFAAGCALGVVISLLLAIRIERNGKEKGGIMPETPYHRTILETEVTTDYETKQALVDSIVFVAGPGNPVTYRCTKDGTGIEACCGKEDRTWKLWYSNCCGELECIRTYEKGNPPVQLDPQDLKDFVYDRLP